jgi:ubiquinone/menaquinone biosynthesis C-methylase UbiE
VTLSNLERYERIAWAYDLLDLPIEYGRYRKIRPLLFRGLSGRILEAGVGTGRNFPFYPPGSEVVGIDLSPAMLARAERRRPMAATKVELRQMDVTRLSFPGRSFDAACSQNFSSMRRRASRGHVPTSSPSFGSPINTDR